MDDEANRPPKILGHAYWLPGLEGVALEAALTDLVSAPVAVRLTITKTRTERGWMYEFETVKGDP